MTELFLEYIGPVIPVLFGCALMSAGYWLFSLKSGMDKLKLVDRRSKEEVVNYFESLRETINTNTNLLEDVRKDIMSLQSLSDINEEVANLKTQVGDDIEELQARVEDLYELHNRSNTKVSKYVAASSSNNDNASELCHVVEYLDRTGKWIRYGYDGVAWQFVAGKVQEIIRQLIANTAHDSAGKRLYPSKPELYRSVNIAYGNETDESDELCYIQYLQSPNNWVAYTDNDDDIVIFPNLDRARIGVQTLSGPIGASKYPKFSDHYRICSKSKPAQLFASVRPGSAKSEGNTNEKIGDVYSVEYLGYDDYWLPFGRETFTHKDGAINKIRELMSNGYFPKELTKYRITGNSKAYVAHTFVND